MQSDAGKLAVMRGPKGCGHNKVKDNAYTIF